MGGKEVQMDPGSITRDFKPSYVPAGAEVAYRVDVTGLDGGMTSSYSWSMDGGPATQGRRGSIRSTTPIAAASTRLLPRTRS